jgi:hypothetical protein
MNHSFEDEVDGESPNCDQSGNTNPDVNIAIGMEVVVELVGLVFEVHGISFLFLRGLGR